MWTWLVGRKCLIQHVLVDLHRIQQQRKTDIHITSIKVRRVWIASVFISENKQRRIFFENLTYFFLFLRVVVNMPIQTLIIPPWLLGRLWYQSLSQRNSSLFLTEWFSLFSLFLFLSKRLWACFVFFLCFWFFHEQRFSINKELARVNL